MKRGDKFTYVVIGQSGKQSEVETRGRYIGTTPTGCVWVCYGDDELKFAQICARFDKMYPKNK